MKKKVIVTAAELSGRVVLDEKKNVVRVYNSVQGAKLAVAADPKNVSFIDADEARFFGAAHNEEGHLVIIQ